jgi:nucleoside-diphosphate-sugar epimerase
MKILVTGGVGFIGHGVVAKLEKQGHKVCVIDNFTNYGIIPEQEIKSLHTERLSRLKTTSIHHVDIKNYHDVSQVFEECRPDVVIHCAAFPRAKVVDANPTEGCAVLTSGLINLLRSSEHWKVRRFVYISSSMVYGDFNMIGYEDMKCEPKGIYGILKLAGEALTRDHCERAGMDYVILRPSAVYGPLDVEDRVVAKFMLAAMRGSTLNVNGANETLDFTYVDDAADGIVAAATRIMAANKTYNITKSHSVSLLEAAEMIVKIVGKGTIEVKDKDADFPSRGSLNIDRAKTILGYDPKVDVEQGFENYYNWLNNSVYWSKKAV